MAQTDGDDEAHGLVRNQVAERAEKRNGAASTSRWTLIRSWKMALFGLALLCVGIGILAMWKIRPDATETATSDDLSNTAEKEDVDEHLDFPFLRDDGRIADLVADVDLPEPSAFGTTTSNTEEQGDPTTATMSPSTTKRPPKNASPDSDDDNEDSRNALFSTQLQVEQCRKLKQKKQFPDKNSFEYKLASANCGWDYDYANPSSTIEPWSVVLFGRGWSNSVLNISGCPLGGAKCPSAPLCNITVANDVPRVSRADVIVAFQEDATQSLKHLQKDFPRLKRQYRVLYFREGHTPHPIAANQEKYDFEMGVHFYAELYNPTYMRRPSELLSASIPPYPPLPLIPLQEKTKFAMWAISDCKAISQRDLYIARMTRVLGPGRVHGYGGCGNLKLPQKPINNAAKLISEYKFYFSFENIIQQGYVSEKLFWILTIPVVPVYYGAPNVPNITTVPSYINVADFKNPEAVAQYLLHLDSHPEEYNKYHVWRDKSGKYFTEEYLDAIRFKFAGPEEAAQFSNNRFGTFAAPQRTAQCCRLCDKRYVQWAVHQRQENKKLGISRVTDMSHSHVVEKFFSG